MKRLNEVVGLTAGIIGLFSGIVAATITLSGTDHGIIAKALFLGAGALLVVAGLHGCATRFRRKTPEPSPLVLDEIAPGKPVWASPLWQRIAAVAALSMGVPGLGWGLRMDPNPPRVVYEKPSSDGETLHIVVADLLTITEQLGTNEEVFTDRVLDRFVAQFKALDLNVRVTQLNRVITEREGGSQTARDWAHMDAIHETLIVFGCKRVS